MPAPPDHRHQRSFPALPPLFLSPPAAPETVNRDQKWIPAIFHLQNISRISASAPFFRAPETSLLFPKPHSQILPAGSRSACTSFLPWKVWTAPCNSYQYTRRPEAMFPFFPAAPAPAESALPRTYGRNFPDRKTSRFRPLCCFSHPRGRWCVPCTFLRPSPRTEAG